MRGASRACSTFPAFEAFFAVGAQTVVILEIEFPAVFCRLIVFAIVVVMVTADLWPYRVDAATSSRFNQVPALGGNQQIPAVIVLVDLDVFMGYLP